MRSQHNGAVSCPDFVLRVLRLAVPAALIVAAGLSGAAASQSYTLKLAKTGDGALDEAIKASSLLAGLSDAPPDTVFALIDRARSDTGRINTALMSYGYYGAGVTITIAGHDVSDMASLALLQESAEPLTVAVTIDKGPLYRLGKIDLSAPVPADAQSAMGLHPGDPAVAAVVLAGGARLQDALLNDGYAFARVDAPDAEVDDAAERIDLAFPVDTGQKADLGTITVTGNDHLDDTFLRQTLGLNSGDPFKPQALETARNNLLGLDVFSSVTVRVADAPDAQNRAPIFVDVVERKRRSVAFSAEYTTDLGGSVSASWMHRNLLGKGEHLTLSASATGLGGTAVDGLGYDLSAVFDKPRFTGEGRHLQLSLAALKQSLDAYDQTAESLKVGLAGKLTPDWSASTAIDVTYEDVKQAGVTRAYHLFSLPMAATFDNTGAAALSDPLSGYRAALRLTPVVSLGVKDTLFAKLEVSGSAYFDLTGDGRSVLAMRALVGSMQGASNSDMPPDQRFYAGGSATVRGFRYQSIGPRLSNGDPAGASSVDAVSLEWRQRVLDSFGFAVFADAGQAGTSSLPFDGSLQLGAGAGVRYYTPIGTIRFDIAMPLSTVESNDRFQIYIGLGQAF